MGVPALFHWLLYRFPRAIVPVLKASKYCDIRDEITEDDVPQVDCLYFDANSIIHNACHGNDPLPPDATEDDMICRIFEQLDTVISIVKPKKLVYIAIDGTVPCSKLLQQRARRFQNDERDAGKWDSNVISPGTKFMKKVSDALKWYIYDRVNTDEEMKKLAFVLSDSNVSGEGEHKILSYIHSLRSTPGYEPNTSHCIVAQDADLILLGLAAHIPHFFILREHQTHLRPPPGRYPPPRHRLAVRPGWDFVALGTVRDYLSIDYGTLIHQRGVDFEKIVDDFVLLCMLMGNDFLPSLPTIYVKEGALDELLGHYRQHFCGHLIEDTKIRYDRLALILQHFAAQEDRVFAARHHWHTRIGDDTFSFREPNYRMRYRDAKLNGDDLRVARAYLQGLQWCMDYYFTGNCSWEWSFGHNFPPLVSALAHACIEFTATPDVFQGGPPLQPLESLMAILPRSSNEALPAVFRELTVDGGALADLYSAEPAIEKIAGRTIIITPPIDVARLKAATRDPAVQAKLAADERTRNSFNAPLAYVHLDLLPSYQHYALLPSDLKKDAAEGDDGAPPAKRRKLDSGFPPPTDGIAAMVTNVADTYADAAPIGGSFADGWDMFDPVEKNRVVCVELSNSHTHKHSAALSEGTVAPKSRLMGSELGLGSQWVFRPIVARMPRDKIVVPHEPMPLPGEEPAAPVPAAVPAAAVEDEEEEFF